MQSKGKEKEKKAKERGAKSSTSSTVPHPFIRSPFPRSFFPFLINIVSNFFRAVLFRISFNSPHDDVSRKGGSIS